MKPYFLESNHFDQAFPFDQLQTEDFLPALDESIKNTLDKIQGICVNKESPDFRNTVLELESSMSVLDQLASLYFNLFSAEADPQWQALAAEVSPKLAAFNSDLYLNQDLYQRLLAVSKDTLDDASKRLLDVFLTRFERNGAKLSVSKQRELREIDKELSSLGPKFSENVLNATNAYTLHVRDKESLSNIPGPCLAQAAELAQEKGLEGYVFTLEAPSMIPFLDYCDNQDLRKEMYTAYASRCLTGEHDNSSIVTKLNKLRHKRSMLLGFNNHADYTLRERMAKSPEQVFEFIDMLKAPAEFYTKKELAEMKETFQLKAIEPWDIRYYIEKLRAVKLDYRAEEVMNYLDVEQVFSGLFTVAKRLFNLTFLQDKNIPTYHDDVIVYQAFLGDTYQGLLYIDLYPRKTKKPGAWMTCYREQNGSQRPHVSLCCNFTKPDANGLSLLTIDEVQTLYHEFGHGLHALLSNSPFKTLSGTNVFWDFVELPSQLMENWVTEKEVLDLFAFHHETKAKIPDELVKKLRDGRKFMAGYYTLRQLRFAYLDMLWHSAEVQPDDISSWERKSLTDYDLIPAYPGTATSTAFSHIFAGGYSAGYYSYKWAEVLEADAFSLFKEKGLFDKETAESLVENILSKGNSDDPEVLFERFRGRSFSPEALLERDGLLH